MLSWHGRHEFLMRHTGVPTVLSRVFLRQIHDVKTVGHLRGGRNTKIHALADAKGRLIAMLLSGGQAHDCPAAERLIRRVDTTECMLGDKAYDSAELREKLDETKPVIPNRSSRKQPFTFNKSLYKVR
jgi:IS5 family transposase